jgi:hypothetical protein
MAGTDIDFAPEERTKIEMNLYRENYALMQSALRNFRKAFDSQLSEEAKQVLGLMIDP